MTTAQLFAMDDNIVQSEIRRINGSPEGVLYADYGYEVVNGLTGDKWIKKSAATAKTGWVRLATTEDIPT